MEQDFIEEGDRVSIDPTSGEIRNETNGNLIQAMPLPPFMRKMVECGGLVPYIKQQARNSK